jgi:nucleoside-diphosphate-sugar epimerase
MNILVTGGAGFLGAHLVSALQAAGHECFAYDVANAGPELLAVAPTLAQRLRIGSIEDGERLLEACRADRIELIVHAAARLGLEPSLADPVGFYRTNVLGQVNVCEVARKLGLPKVIAISSNAVYHPGAGDRLVETDPAFSVTRANPAAHYGTSKLAAEAIGMAYAEFHGLEFLALRVTAVYGFGMRAPIHVKPMVENGVLRKPTRFETGGPMKRDYTHVADCCDALVKAVELGRLPPGSQRIFNVAAGRVHTVDEVAEVVRRIVPGADIEVGPGLTPVQEANVRMRAPLDTTAARKLLRWTPRLSLEDGIAEYAERYRQYEQARAR